jgi:hypothetical protein
MGFADSVVENEKGKAKNAWNLSAFAKAPKQEPAPEPVAEPSMTTANANRLRLTLL